MAFASESGLTRGRVGSAVPPAMRRPDGPAAHRLVQAELDIGAGRIDVVAPRRRELR
jgi:hypothetical protein